MENQPITARMTTNEPPTMNAYDCHYYDRNGNHRIFCTYAKDVLTARYTLIELVGKDLCRITGIVKVDGFDW